MFGIIQGVSSSFTDKRRPDYYHCDRLSSTPHRLLNLPEKRLSRSAEGASGRHLSVK